MGDAKQLFQKDKDKRDSLAACVGADWFKVAMAFAKAELMDDPTVSAQELAGARKLENILIGLPNPEDQPIEFPGPGMHHDLPRRNREPEQTHNQSTQQ